MSTSQVGGPAPAGHRRRMWGLILLLLFAIVATAIVIRGTWADTVARDPKSSAEGTICQLYLSADGRKQVRCARVLDYPADQVWSVVTDYRHFGEIFPYEKDVKGEREPDGRFHVTGIAHAWPYGSWPFNVHVTHEELPGIYRASWDDPGGNLKQNRGSWAVTALGPQATLLVFTLEMEVSPYPTFYVHNVLLNRLKAMLAAVDSRLRAARAP